METLTFDDGMNVLAARTQFFASYGFGADGGYHESWVKIQLGPLPIVFPNTEQRKRSLKLHDLHHVTTGYATNWCGEGEISAWEVGGGCGNHLAAWGINLSGMMLGLIITPVTTWRAFVRGRHTINLYHLVGDFDERLLELSVGALRAKMGLNVKEHRATLADIVYFVALLLVAIPWSLVQGVAFLLALPLVFLTLRPR